MKAHSVTVRVPATTANLGPGFDALGMALDIWNTVRIRVQETGGVSITGEGSSQLSREGDNLVYRAASLVFQQARVSEPGLSISCHNDIPLGRGLGSSAAAVVGGLLAANSLCDEPFSQEQLLELATELEGHPDNVTAALLGGCQIVVRDGTHLITAPITLAQELWCVLYIPDRPMPTAESRATLPSRVSQMDAVYNIGRVALLINALTTGRFQELRVATQDRLHQPMRLKMFPPAKYIFRAALDAGALAVFLSGGGSSVLALTLDREMTIGYEMATAGDKMGAPGQMKITRPSPLGAHVTQVE